MCLTRQREPQAVSSYLAQPCRLLKVCNVNFSGQQETQSVGEGAITTGESGNE